MADHTTIKKVAVLGAGNMGAGIAGQVANAGLPVLLLDVTREAAERGKQDLFKRKPAPLMSAAAADLIETGGFDQDLPRLAEADWIVEVVVERLPVKQALFERVERVRRPGSIVSSNTSGIRLSEITAGLPASFAADFCITHFFNPPRYMGLLELIAGPATRPDAVDTLRAFCTVQLGKEVVDARDTPSFIGNRIGILAMLAGVRAAQRHGLTVEQADAVAGKPIGWPGTGVFGLIDLVGLDVLADVARNMQSQLPAGDPAHPLLELPPLLKTLLERGWIGRKAGGGFYRMTADKQREALDLSTLEYRPAQKVDLASAKARGPKDVLAGDDAGARFAADMLGYTLAYTATVASEIAGDVRAIDTAMREGYSWRAGPFELLDEIGLAGFVERLAAAGEPVPALLQKAQATGDGRFYREEADGPEYLGFDGAYHAAPSAAGTLAVADLRRAGKPVLGNASASLWDMGDGVALLEFHTKMNALDEFSVEAMELTLDRVGRDFQALVIGSDAPHFCAGANLKRMLDAARAGDFTFLDGFIDGLQHALMGFKYAPFPVVGAPRGLALGGGCEVLLHCNVLQAHAELNAGLVELRVGLLPAGGGTKEMTLRHLDAGVERGFDLVVGSVTSSSAADARAMRVLTDYCAITMHRRRVLADAKALARRMVGAYAPARPAVVNLPGPAGRAALEARVAPQVEAGKMTAHDAVVASHIAAVMSGGAGGEVTEHDLLRLEREHFLELLRLPPSQARMEHMLATGKPLRN
ncbi:MAG: 3-hydroxyacyl-CoA dehydrogenase NAD-binding domain-containing protein [Immundisolibacter sp.]|uniref:3-hydroxyacyl-CoA dehydrogenase/enoyl-CoA hydratase family protein n=1 Tax=Immundisolibacter sp. TaxID=1934948 RepID=UPI003D12FF63